MTLRTAFARLADPRIARRRRYALGDLLFIALCAVLCGANNFVEIEVWARAKQEWLQERLDLQHGIPSHDTGEIAPQFTRFGRVFARLDAKIFAECFHQWTQSIATRVKGDIIAIDGKEVRHSFDLTTGQCTLHLVSAWACRHHLVLEQEAVRDKSNEITAIPELLYRLDVEGCLVTIDAMGCQKNIADQIYSQKADYCLALKGNQGDLHKTVEQFFTRSRANKWLFDQGVFARPIKPAKSAADLRELAVPEPREGTRAYRNPSLFRGRSANRLVDHGSTLGLVGSFLCGLRRKRAYYPR